MSGTINHYKEIVALISDDLICRKIVKFVDAHLESTLGKGEEAIVYKLKINGYYIAMKITPYNASPSYIYQKFRDPPDRYWIETKLNLMHIMVESRIEGLHIFPDIYGIVDCQNGPDSKLYVAYEYFEGDLEKLIFGLTNPNDWYEIIFRLCFIHHYLFDVKSVNYRDGRPANHLYKNTKPTMHVYQMESYNFHIKQKYLICIWDINASMNSKIGRNNLDYLLAFIRDNSSKIKARVPRELYKMLIEITKHPDQMPEILNKVYNKN